MSDRSGNGPLVFLTATEASGDLMGAGLMEALKSRTDGRIRFAGLGGDRMTAQGLTPLFPISELAVMGVLELIPQMRRLLRRVAETAAAAIALKPDIIVTIDSWAFSSRIAHRLVGRRRCPLVQFVAPKAWAWRPGRARKLARIADHLLAQLPFEPAFFARHGLDSTFIGHPITESGAGEGDAAAFRARHGLAAEVPLAVILPGSRTSEADRLLPVLGAVAERLRARYPDLRFVVPTVFTVAERVRSRVNGWPGAPIVVEGDREKYDAFAAAGVAVAASGTVALELALAGVPSVITYRVNPLTAFVVRRLIKVRFANLVNLVADREVVPELLQDACTPDRITAAVTALIDDPQAGRAQAEAARRTAQSLRADGESPSRRAAAVVLDLLARSTAGRYLGAMSAAPVIDR